MNIISRERLYINSLIVKQNGSGFYIKVGVKLFLSSLKEGASNEVNSRGKI